MFEIILAILAFVSVINILKTITLKIKNHFFPYVKEPPYYVTGFADRWKDRIRRYKTGWAIHKIEKEKNKNLKKNRKITTY